MQLNDHFSIVNRASIRAWHKWWVWGSLASAANIASFHIPAGCFAIQLQAAPEGVERTKGIAAACLPYPPITLIAIEKS
jgi:hypothetical protein